MFDHCHPPCPNLSPLSASFPLLIHPAGNREAALGVIIAIAKGQPDIAASDLGICVTDNRLNCNGNMDR